MTSFIRLPSSPIACFTRLCHAAIRACVTVGPDTTTVTLGAPFDATTATCITWFHVYLPVVPVCHGGRQGPLDAGLKWRFFGRGIATTAVVDHFGRFERIKYFAQGISLTFRHPTIIRNGDFSIPAFLISGHSGSENILTSEYRRGFHLQEIVQTRRRLQSR